MKFRHIPTGTIVHSDSELPSALYEKVDVQAAEKPKAEPKKRKAGKKETSYMKSSPD